MEPRVCDICGHLDIKHKLKHSDEKPLLLLDEDGLWICNPCQKLLKSNPIGFDDEEPLDDDLKPLVGKSAGAICRTLELVCEPPFDSVIEAASIIAYDQDRYMSAWLFVKQWRNGTSVW
jgi:hypothetical protein